VVFKQTWLSVSDNTSVRWLKTFHLYKGFRRSVSRVGFFIKGSARVVEPPRTEYKGFKFKFNKKGDICRGIILRAAYPLRRLDGSCNRFFSNNIILIKKKQNIKSKYLMGPSTYHLKRKKFKTALKLII
jgi:large subunit ribosomal protein L14